MGYSSCGGYIMALDSVQTLADYLMVISAVSLSSTSIQRIGEERDILEDIMLMLVSFSSLSKNSAAAIFLISLYLGWLISTLLVFNEMC